MDCVKKMKYGDVNGGPSDVRTPGTSCSDQETERLLPSPGDYLLVNRPGEHLPVPGDHLLVHSPGDFLLVRGEILPVILLSPPHQEIISRSPGEWTRR